MSALDVAVLRQQLDNAARGAVQQAARVRHLTERLDNARTLAVKLEAQLDGFAADLAAWRRLPWWRRVWRALRGRL